MPESSTAEDLIRGLQAGEAAPFLAASPNGHPVFLVRERSTVIRYLGESGVAVRGGMFPLGHVVVTVVAFRVGRHFFKEYAVWLDYHDPSTAGMFPAMSGSEYLAFFFHGDSCRREKTIIAANPLTAFFDKAIQRIRPLPCWTGEHFKAAVSRILSRYPTPVQLWEVLAAPLPAN